MKPAVAVGLVAGAAFAAFGAAHLYARAGRTPGASYEPHDGLGVHLGVSVDDDHHRPWLCQPSDMDAVLGRAHPLYRRPSRPRPGSADLAERGWRAWYLAPPENEDL